MTGKTEALDRYAFLSFENGKRYERGINEDSLSVAAARDEVTALLEQPGSRLIYFVREFIDYTARVQRIDSRVVKNYAEDMRKALVSP